MVNLQTGKSFSGVDDSATHHSSLVTRHSDTLTRRSALKGLAAILAAGVAPSLCGSITRGMQYRNLAGRLAAMGGDGEAVNPFIDYGHTDKCVGFFDAQFNTENGFDSTATTLADLSENQNPLTLTGSVEWTDGMAYLNNSYFSGINGPFYTITSPYQFTFECVCDACFDENIQCGLAYIYIYNDWSLKYDIYSRYNYVCSMFRVSVLYQTRNQSPTRFNLSYRRLGEETSLWLNGMKMSSRVNSPATTIYNGEFYLGRGQNISGIKKIGAFRAYSEAFSDSEMVTRYQKDKARFNLP